MARDWEAWIANSMGPASADEESKRDRTEARIKSAIASDVALSRSVRVQAKGSYANSTNVRLDSDVDIAVEWRDQFKVDTFGEAVGMSASQLGYEAVHNMISPEDLRARIERVLIGAFPTGTVDTSGGKAIRVSANTGTLDADVVPCFSLRRYDRPQYFHEGQRVYSKRAGHVDNWPEQNKRNSNEKNTRTGRRYKGMIRALKRLENELVANRALSSPVPGYLVECLVWNVPDEGFGHARLTDDMRFVLATVFNDTLSDSSACKEWGEVNELKCLFRGAQAWTRSQAHDFANAAWDAMGFD